MPRRWSSAARHSTRSPSASASATSPPSGRRCAGGTRAGARASRSAASDALPIGFGIRNVTDIGQALREAYRVLRPGGRFLCLEFSRVDVPVIETLYDLYSLTTIPALGKIVTGDGQPYRYLVESIRRFPDAASFARKMEDAGFSQVSFRILSAGVVAIHSGWRT